MNIHTISDLKVALKHADIVLVQIRFGTNENWVKVSKKEIADILKGYRGDTSLLEIETSAELTNGHLLLG